METGRMELRPAGEDRWELFLRETGEECGLCRGRHKIKLTFQSEGKDQYGNRTNGTSSCR